MKNKILLFSGIVLMTIIAVMVISKIAVTARLQASEKNAGAVKIESGSKEEGDLLKAQEAVEKANIDMLFSTLPTPDSIMYEVQKGDTLSKISKKFSTTQDLIMKENNLKDYNVVPLGRKLKIHNEKISVVVDKSQNILTLKSGDKILKTYRVSTGVNNSTPVGTFKVINKIVDPPWYTAGSVIPADSPKNILGSRWLGLSAKGYGIHGTTEPQSIGRQVTSGCVRMKNQDVEELYKIVPDGAEVVIVD